MISVQNVSAGGQGASYYAQDNYYTNREDGLQNSSWFGKAAQKLGLVGNVTANDLDRMLNGEINEEKTICRIEYDENGEKKLVHRGGTDFTFSAPKSVSVLSEVYGIQEIRDAHEQAVYQTLEHIENEYAKTRMSVDGNIQQSDVDGIAVALFQHNMTRNQDPQTHTHAVILNVTEGVDGQFRALDNSVIFNNRKLLDAMYMNYMAQHLKQLGYELSFNKDGTFEIAGVDKEILDIFSSRKKDIDDYLIQQGIDPKVATSREREIAALASRLPKDERNHQIIIQKWKEKAEQKGLSQELAENLAKKNQDLEVHLLDNIDMSEIWQKQIEHLTGIDREQILKNIHQPESIKDNETALKKLPTQVEINNQNAVKKDVYSVFGMLSEREVMIDELRLRAEVLKRANGQYGIEEVANEIERLVDEKIYTRIGKQITTPTLIDKEKRVLAALEQGVYKEGKEDFSILSIGDAEIKLNTAEKNVGTVLTDGQYSSAISILASKDQYIAIQGLAGTGKTTMLKTVVEVVKDLNKDDNHNIKIEGIAATSAAAKVLHDELGNGRTISSFINNETKKLERIKGDSSENNQENRIIVVDEASLISLNDIDKLIDIAERTGSKIIFQGDQHQKEAIQAGTMFNVAIRKGVMKTSYLNQVNRQKTDELKEVVQAMIKIDTAGNVDIDARSGINALDKKGMVLQTDSEQLHKTVADMYVNYDKQTQDNTLIVTGMRKDREKLNNSIRDMLEEKNILSGPKQVLKVLDSKYLTEEERKDINSYNVGDIVVFHQNYKRVGNNSKGKVKYEYELGNKYKVSKNDNKTLTLERVDGKNEVGNPINEKKTIQIKELQKIAKRSQIYQIKEIAVQQNVKLRATSNIVDGDKSVSNGTTLTVGKIKNGVIETVVDNQKSIYLNVDEHHFVDYGYVMTVMSSQGQTAQNVIALVNTEENKTQELIQNGEKTKDEESRIRLNQIKFTALTNDKASMYVILTRPTHSINVVTDNAEVLKNASAIEVRKTSAIIAQDKLAENEHIQEKILAEREKRQQVIFGPKDDIQERLKEVSPLERNVSVAVNAALERETMIDRNKVEENLLKLSEAEYSIRDVRKYMDGLINAGLLIQVGNKLTNQRMSKGEIFTIEHVQDESHSLDKIMNDSDVEKELQGLEQQQGFQYTIGQYRAIKDILTTDNRYHNIQGLAGTGKTTMLSAVKKIATEKGFIIKGMSITGNAAKNLELETGIASTTVATFKMKQQILQDEIDTLRIKGQDIKTKPEIWVIDEASFLDQENAIAIMNLAKQADARVVMVGDKYQLPSISAGKTFENIFGVTSKSFMTQINRQKDSDLKEVVNTMIFEDDLGRIQQNSIAAFDKMREKGMITESDEFMKDAVDDYMRSSAEERTQIALMTFFNKDKNLVNKMVHDRRVENGELQGVEHKMTILEHVREEQAYRRVISGYKKGQIIKFLEEYKQEQKKGQSYVFVKDVAYKVEGVVDAKKGVLIVSSENNPHQQLILNVTDATHKNRNNIMLYEENKRELMKNEIIKITRSHYQKDLNSENKKVQLLTGHKFRVIEINNDTVLIESLDGKQKLTVSKEELKHWDYGYADTVYSSQGLTVDKAILVFNTMKDKEQTSKNKRNKINKNGLTKDQEKKIAVLSKIIGRKSFNVAVTRSRSALHIYTDDLKVARGLVDMDQKKTSYVEALSEESLKSYQNPLGFNYKKLSSKGVTSRENQTVKAETEQFNNQKHNKESSINIEYHDD